MQFGRIMGSTLVLVVALSLSVVESAPDGGHGVAWIHTSQQLVKRGEEQYCGARLFEAIRTLCNGNYAALSRRSDPALSGTGFYEDSDAHEHTKNTIDKMVGLNSELPSQDFETDTWEDNSLTDFDVVWPRIPKSLALKIITEGTTHHRLRRNVIDECCKKPCGARTMLKYCGSVRQ